ATRPRRPGQRLRGIGTTLAPTLPLLVGCSTGLRTMKTGMEWRCACVKRSAAFAVSHAIAKKDLLRHLAPHVLGSGRPGEFSSGLVEIAHPAPLDFLRRSRLWGTFMLSGGTSQC